MPTTTRGTYIEDDSLLLFEQAQRDLETRRSGVAAPLNHGYAGDVDGAKQRLLLLRQQQDEMDRQEQEMDLLKNKQDRFTSTRRELGEQIHRLLASLEREMRELEEAGEVMGNARQLLSRDLQRVRAIDSSQWAAEDLHEELDEALTILDDASDHLEKVERRLSVVWNVIGPRDLGASLLGRGAGGSWDCLRRGFLYSLPMMAFVAVLYSLARLGAV